MIRVNLYNNLSWIILWIIGVWWLLHMYRTFRMNRRKLFVMFAFMIVVGILWRIYPKPYEPECVELKPSPWPGVRAKQCNDLITPLRDPGELHPARPATGWGWN